jgi:hypothetical protein
MSRERHTRSYTASRSGFSTSRLGDGENHKRIEAWSVARGAAVSISPVVRLLLNPKMNMANRDVGLYFGDIIDLQQY